MSSQKTMSNLGQRVIMAIIGAAVMIGGIVWNQWSLSVVFLIISTISLLEFYGLFRQSKKHSPQSASGVVMNVLIFGITIYSILHPTEGSSVFYILPLLLICLTPLLSIFELFRKTETPFQNVAITFFGLFYITLPFLLVTYIGIVIGYQFILFILFITWTNDSGAYFIGKSIGKTKFFERISPKKTWEGTIGGLILSIGVSIALVYAFGFDKSQLIVLVGLGIIISIFTTLGDLCESMLKRSLNIKDSGTILPGHGGFLDRFDGLLVSGPIIFTYIQLFF